MKVISMKQVTLFLCICGELPQFGYHDLYGDNLHCRECGLHTDWCSSKLTAVAAWNMLITVQCGTPAKQQATEQSTKRKKVKSLKYYSFSLRTLRGVRCNMANSEIIGAGQDTARRAPKINTIYQENCISTMALMPDCFVDLTVTSPPYDNMRKYNMFDFKFDTIAPELYRVTKCGGVVVWVVNDKTENGSETGTSFRQALFFQEVGFNLETMIWEKTGSGCLGSNSVYAQNFEYMFILSKGKIKTHNLICDRENKVKGGSVKVNQGINDEGKATSVRVVERKPFGKRNNIWRFDTQKNSSHPAPFPEQLAQDHILSWSNEGDLVYDPFIGSGTTAKMAVVNGRNFIGSEVSEEYCRIAEERIHALRSPAQDTMEICHTAPNTRSLKNAQLAMEL